MDEDLAWFRAQLRDALIRRLVAEFVVVVVVMSVAGRLGGPMARLGIVGAVLFGIGVVVARIGLALVTNPLQVRYLREFAAAPPARLSPAPGGNEPETGSVAASVERSLSHEGFTMCGALVTGDDALTATVWKLGSGEVVASVDRNSGVLVVLSRLDRGSVLSTSTALVPPTASVVVQTVHGAAPGRVVQAHLRALGAVRASGGGPVPDDVSLVLEGAEEERAAYRGLGVLAVFADLVGAAAASPSLTVRVSPAAVLDRGMRRACAAGGPREEALVVRSG